MAFNKTELLGVINGRFDNLEKLLQLLLINNLVGDVNQSIQIIDETVDTRLNALLAMYGLSFGGFKSVYGMDILEVEIPDDIKLKVRELCLICADVRLIYPDKEPFFMFKSINGMQRKRVLQENISFGVKGKELHMNCIRRR